MVPINCGQQIADIRRQAAHARVHAVALAHDEAAPRLRALAQELDAEADALEEATGRSPLASPEAASPRS